VVALVAPGVIVALLALGTFAVQDPEGSRQAAAAGTTIATTTSRPPAPSTSAPVPAKELPPGPRTLSAAEIARGQTELADVAARLSTPVSLASRPEWDQWLPAGKPYPGVDLADDLSTCPVLSDRLETVVGQEMSYWTGTLPNGPGGCTWVETPLSGENNDYDYYISVGFLADGTTVEDFRRYRQGPGQGTHPCPSADLPSAADGALLVRCTSSGVSGYTLAVPDTRLDGGLWVLIVQSKDSTPVRPAEILPVLVDGVVAAFG
jgi:hypothetical protein